MGGETVVTVFSILLLFHVAIAAVGLASGFMAILSPKGSRLHLRAGKIFVASMLVMTCIAFTLAVMHADLISIVPSLLTFYLVATGWCVVTRKSGTTQALDYGLLALAVAAGTAGFILGTHAAHSPSGADNRGFPAAVYFTFGSIAFVAGALDVRMLVYGGVRGVHRLVRHLWRMGLAMLIATTSFFQGQEQVFPKALQGALLLKVPAYLVLAITLYWLLRLLAARPKKGAVAQAIRPPLSLSADPTSPPTWAVVSRSGRRR